MNFKQAIICRGLLLVVAAVLGIWVSPANAKSEINYKMLFKAGSHFDAICSNDGHSIEHVSSKALGLGYIPYKRGSIREWDRQMARDERMFLFLGEKNQVTFTVSFVKAGTLGQDVGNLCVFKIVGIDATESVEFLKESLKGYSSFHDISANDVKRKFQFVFPQPHPLAEIYVQRTFIGNQPSTLIISEDRNR